MRQTHPAWWAQLRHSNGLWPQPEKVGWSNVLLGVGVVGEAISKLRPNSGKGVSHAKKQGVDRWNTMC